MPSQSQYNQYTSMVAFKCKQQQYHDKCRQFDVQIFVAHSLVELEYVGIGRQAEPMREFEWNDHEHRARIVCTDRRLNVRESWVCGGRAKREIH